DGAPIRHLARYDGSAWSAIGGSVIFQGLGNGRIDDTVVMPNGDLVVGGNFTSTAGVPAIGLARWDGATWSAFGDPIFPWQVGTVGDLILQPNGELVVAGSFQSIGGVSANGVAAWNGSTWSPLGQIGSGFVGVGQLVRLPT